MCSKTDSGNINDVRGYNFALSSSVVAHEIGHNLGTGHDGPQFDGGTACPPSGFVMNSLMARMGREAQGAFRRTKLYAPWSYQSDTVTGSWPWREASTIGWTVRLSRLNATVHRASGLVVPLRGSTDARCAGPCAGLPPHGGVPRQARCVWVAVHYRAGTIR